MELILITNKADVAAYAQRCGVDRIMVDLEQLYKHERQGHLDTVISAHSLDDVVSLRSELDAAKLLVRVNPIHKGSKPEIDAVIEGGADIVMLPMFRTVQEVETFVSIVAGRAQVNLLLETPQALVRVDAVLAVPGIHEVHIGLNDLCLGLGLDFMFELLSGGMVSYLAEKVQAKGIRFGFGGVARLGHGKVRSELILAEHVRLGSEMVILSRDFHDRSHTLADLKRTMNLSDEVRNMRDHCRILASATEDQKKNYLEDLRLQVNDVVAEKHETSLP